MKFIAINRLFVATALALMTVMSGCAREQPGMLSRFPVSQTANMPVSVGMFDGPDELVAQTPADVQTPRESSANVVEPAKYLPPQSPAVSLASTVVPSAASVPQAAGSHATGSVAKPAGLITLRENEDLMSVIADAPGSVLLDFYADWCGPCRTQGKILHEFESTAAAQKTQIVKINVDEHPQLAKQLSVSSLPTLVLVKDQRVAKRQTGLMRKSQLLAWIR